MSSVVMDGKDGKELNFTELVHFFQVPQLCLQTLPKKLWLLFLHKTCLIASSKFYTRAFCVWVKALNNDFSTELTSNSNILMA